MYIYCEIKLWPQCQLNDFAIANSLFGAVTLTKNTGRDRYSYSGYDN